MPEFVSLPRATPQSKGVDPAAIERFVAEADAQSAALHSLMIVREGQVVAETWWAPYRSDLRHTMFSVSKSFAATAVGLAVDDGLLRVDEPILSIFPTYASAANRANIGAMTLHNVLTMSTGHEVDTMPIMRAQPLSDWLEVFLSTPVVYPPGEHFLYNSGASFVLAAAVTARTGMSLIDYLTPRLFEPLGMTTPPWEESPQGIALGASGLRLFTEDLAKLGLLYLQGGEWEGRRILSREWVTAATGRQVATESEAPDWSAGYGYQFWQSTHQSYRADGAYGQFSFVLPEHNAVVAITAGLKQNWRIPPLVWEHLLPAFLTVGTRAASGGEPDLSGLSVATPAFLEAPPSTLDRLDGQRYELPFNTLGIAKVALRFDGPEVALELTTTDGSTEKLRARSDEWTPGSTRLWPYDEGAEQERTETASKSGWLDDRVFEIHQQCIETAFRRIWTFHVDDAGNLDLTIKLDLGYWSDRSETLRGRRIDAKDH